MASQSFKNKKVLVFGLGLLGGGVATTNWLLGQGAKVTVTDLKTQEQLASSLKKIKRMVVLHLGGHSEEDIKNSDIVVFNPDISVKNPYVALARKLGKRIENEATIFYALCKLPIVAITGTRGKTTTATWAQHLLGKTAVLAGNRYDHALLDVVSSLPRYKTVVNEIPSYHLEFFPFFEKAPHIAVMTNLSRDHMNRHGSIEEYAATKANIFMHQSAEDHVILCRDDEWTPFFLKRKPKARIWFFSAKPLKPRERGIFVRAGLLYFQNDDKAQKIVSISSFARERGAHNLQNFLAAALAAHLAGATWHDIGKRMHDLPGISFRQEVIFRNDRLTIVNDTTATSAEGGIAAIRRFAGQSTILIAGGTDRGLEYGAWAKEAKKNIKAQNLILLSGSATVKMTAELGSFSKKIRVFETLEECLKTALAQAKKYKKAVIVLSPAAKSFEKFKNEYDRGERFNQLISETLKKKI